MIQIKRRFNSKSIVYSAEVAAIGTLNIIKYSTNVKNMTENGIRQKFISVPNRS